MQYSAAPAWLFLGVMLSGALTLFVSFLSWLGWDNILAFVFYFLVVAFIACLPLLGLLLFRRFFIEHRPANNSLQWKTVKHKRKP